MFSRLFEMRYVAVRIVNLVRPYLCFRPDLLLPEFLPPQDLMSHILFRN